MDWFFKMFIFSIIGFILFGNVLPVWELFSIILFFYYLYYSLTNIGGTIWIIIDVIIVQALLCWLVLPIIFYHIYNEENYLAVLWVKYMTVPSLKYYSIVLPGTLSMIFGLNYFRNKENYDSYIIYSMQNNLISRPLSVGYALILVSVLSYILDAFVPNTLKFVFFILNQLAVIGFLYLFFSNTKTNLIYLFIAVVVLLFFSIKNGTFGTLIFYSILCLMIVMMKYHVSFILKFQLILISILFLFLIQNIKEDYRKVAWKASGSPTLFFDLILEKIQSPKLLFDDYKLFLTSVRLNQGWLIGKTIEQVPKNVSYANGETILNSILGITIPRLLWPNKPESGGAYNLKRFLNINNVNTSMNLSPIGEAYANFGPIAMCLFMFFYGLFFSFAIHTILKLSADTPTILLWIPLLMLQSLSVETDILSTINSLIKTSIFVYILFKIWPILFKTVL